EARSRSQRRDGARRKVDARKVRDAALLDQREERPAVRRKSRLRVEAVGAERSRHGARVDIDDGEGPGKVVDPLVFALLDIGDAPESGLQAGRDSRLGSL